MHILFIEIDHEAKWAVASIGPAYIASYLRQHGHEVSMLRIPYEMTIEKFIECVMGVNADIHAVSLTSRQWLRACELFNGLHEQSKLPVIAGGLHPTFAAESVLQEQGFDYVCVSEGEQAMLEFVSAIEKNGKLPAKGIDNIWQKNGFKPSLRQPFEPIDELPFMARDMLDEQYGVVHMITQRGCPFPCTYCAARTTSDLYPGSYNDYGRRRSIQNVMDEIQQIKDNGELNYIIFLDDTFTINHAWVKDFCSVYGEKYHIPFSLHARVETINQDMLKQLADCGCMHITYGVESGSERVRSEIMNRNVSNQKIINAFNWTRDAGILVTANYMLGIPGETCDDIEQTLALHHAIKPKDFGYFVFYPYQGTALFKTCQEKGYLPENYNELPANHRESILNLPGLSNEKIRYYYDKFTETRIENHLEEYAGVTDEDFSENIIKSFTESAAKG